MISFIVGLVLGFAFGLIFAVKNKKFAQWIHDRYEKLELKVKEKVEEKIKE
jgi:hypothetical protein